MAFYLNLRSGWDYHQQTQALILIILSIFLSVLDYSLDLMRPLRSAVGVLMYPVHGLVHAPFNWASETSEYLADQKALLTVQEELERRTVSQGFRLLLADRDSSENQHLRDLLELKQRLPIPSTVAEVIRETRSLTHRRWIIDQGTLSHPIKTGQVVMDNYGIIGQVTRVYPLMSEVSLITDSKQMIPVQNARTGQRGVLQGAISSPYAPDHLYWRFVPLGSDVVEGDTLVTSGLDGVYLPGLPVALVFKVKTDPTFDFLQVLTKPMANFHYRRQVMVLKEMSTLPNEIVNDTKVPSGKNSK